MAITVKYFASLREKLGRGEEQIAPEGIATARDVWNRCVKTEPPLKTLVAINLEYAGWDSPAKDGDEVAFFPPVTGG